ncbi:MFS transporter, MCP family, solute carrier family 16, member 7 [Xylogone sp. PMI_703]|nr:MFS transporter, MCP family, solute carrier family 16, member 7 [Xylogone sp. PMI_703]
MAENISISTLRSPSVPLDRQPNQQSSEQSENVEHPNTDLPDGGYGWMCVACNFFIYAHSWGVCSSFAVYIAYYLSHNTFPDTSPLDYAFIGGLSISQSVLIAPLATYIIRLFGTKVCLHIGVFLETLSLIGASFARQKWHIILSQGVCFGWGTGFLFVGSVGIIPQWFSKKRSVANAIASAGTGFGGLTYSLATQRMIDTLGLPWTFRIMGLVTFAVNLTAANLLRDRNRETRSRVRAFDLDILKRPEFILLQGWSYFTILGYVVILFTLPAYAEAIGLTPEQGSIIGAILNLGQMLGRPLIGLASDRWGRLNLATLATLCSGIFCLVFWLPAEVIPNPIVLLCFFDIVGGSIVGTFWGVVAPIGAEVVGLQNLPSALSWTWVLLSIPTTFAEAIAFKIRRPEAQHWSYIGPELFTSFMYFAAALCLWLIRAWKVGQIEAVEIWHREEQIRQSNMLADKVASAGAIQLQYVTTEPRARPRWDSKDVLRRMIVWKIV